MDVRQSEETIRKRARAQVLYDSLCGNSADWKKSGG
jgi:hypothetical protein